MAGIYIHIPFCRQACHYCDFHFSVSLKNKDKIIDSLLKEIELQKEFFPFKTKIDTIYFGGGTPSVLSQFELSQILEKLNTVFSFSEGLEICLEANPDDLEESYLKQIKSLNVNRLSIGVQALDQQFLEWMNRSHTSDQGLRSVETASAMGFKDLSVDLIYGIPGLSNARWEETVQTVLHWPINHLSAYSLTLEDKTAYANLVRKKVYAAPEDDAAAMHYRILNDCMEKADWQQYEVSNYCKEDNYSKHNTSYWKSEPYLGIGPSAHSYDGEHRYWNVSSNAAYIRALDKGVLNQQSEKLDVVDKLNEYLLTSLRTKWGLSLAKIKADFKCDLLAEYDELIQSYILKNWMKLEGDILVLTTEGLLFADSVSSDLFVDHSSQTSS